MGGVTGQDLGNGLSLTVSTPGNGSLLLNADGSFSYTPPTDFSGADSFTYRANDGALSSDPATVTLTVTSDVVLLSLVNADADTIVEPLVNGSELVASDLAFASYSVTASDVPAQTASVVFDLSGQQTHQQTENVAPYALFGDSSGDYAGMPLEPGTYALTAAAFDAGGGGGSKLGSTLVQFTIVDQAAPELVFMNGFEG